MDCITWDRYSIKIDLEVRTVFKSKDRPSYKTRVLSTISYHSVRLAQSLSTHNTTEVMSSVGYAFCAKSVVRA